MSESSLEERVERLESQMAGLLKPNVSSDATDPVSPGMEPGVDDWKQTAAMFRDAPGMNEILDEAARIRDEDRRRSRARSEPSESTRSGEDRE